MEEPPFELTIYGAISIIGLTDKVMDFLGPNSVSRRYVGTRTFHRFYLFDLVDPSYLHTRTHLGAEVWEWWENGYDYDPIAWLDYRHGWRCYLCNSDPKFLEWKRVACVDMYFLRYKAYLPRTEEVSNYIRTNWFFWSRWVCFDCSLLFDCEDHFPIEAVD